MRERSGVQGCSGTASGDKPAGRRGRRREVRGRWRPGLAGEPEGAPEAGLLQSPSGLPERLRHGTDTPLPLSGGLRQVPETPLPAAPRGCAPLRAPLALPPQAEEPGGGRQGCAAWGISGTLRPRLPSSHPRRDERGRWTRAGGTGTMTFAGFVVALVIGTIPGARGLGQVSVSLPAARHPQPHALAPPPPPAGCPAALPGGGFATVERPWPPAAPALPRRGPARRAPRGRRSSCALPGAGRRPGCDSGSGRGRAERGRTDCERGERGGGARPPRERGGCGACGGRMCGWRSGRRDLAGRRALAGRRRLPIPSPLPRRPSLKETGTGTSCQSENKGFSERRF